MFCSISGAPCTDPVLAVPNGLVYERSTIESVIERGALCPVSGITIAAKDIVAIKSPENRAVPLRVPTNASIPTLLRSLQSEYDNLILECHSLKVEKGMLQSQLSTALYQHDAACRVVARLLKEKSALASEHEELKAQFKNFEFSTASAVVASEQKSKSPEPQNQQQQQPQQPQQQAQQVQSQLSAAISKCDIPSESPLAKSGAIDAFKAELTVVSKGLSSTRKQRRGPMMATIEALAELKPAYTLEVQYAGVTFMRAVAPSHAELTHVAIAGKTRGSVLYSMPAFASVTTWPLKSVKISHLEVLAHDKNAPLFVAARKDVVVVVGIADVVSSTQIPADAAVIGLATHPGGKHYGVVLAKHKEDGIGANDSGSSQTYFMLVEAVSGAILYKLSVSVAAAALEARIHPDGILLAFATGNSVFIHDITTGAELTKMVGPAGPAIHMFAFSENGFQLATVDEQGTVLNIWDLRKLQIAFTLAVCTDAESSSKQQVSAIAFDYSGMLLSVSYQDQGATAGKCKVAVFGISNKKWGRVSATDIALPDVIGGQVASIAWGANSRSIIVASAVQKQLCVIAAHNVSDNPSELELPPSRMELRGST